MQALFNFLVLEDASRVSNTKEQEQESLNSLIQIMQSTNTLENTLIFLKFIVNENIFMILVSLI